MTRSAPNIAVPPGDVAIANGLHPGGRGPTRGAAAPGSGYAMAAALSGDVRRARRQPADREGSINRVGLPMIHPLFAQFDEDLGDRLNAGEPATDFERYGEAIISG